MSEGDAFADDQPLDLQKHGDVGGVGLVLAVDLARDDDADGGLPLLHDPDLDGRGVRPQEQVIADIERVPGVPGRVVRREVEGLEIVEISLDFGAILDAEAHLDEDRFDLGLEQAQRMGRAPGPAAAGQGQVDLGAGRGRRLEGSLQGGQLVLDQDLQAVDELSGFALVLGGDIFKLLEEEGHLTVLAAEEDVAQILQPLEVADPGGLVRQVTGGRVDFRPEFVKAGRRHLWPWPRCGRMSPARVRPYQPGPCGRVRCGASSGR